MPVCSVRICKNHNEKTKGAGIKYFRFPKNPDIREQWVKACDSKKLNLTTARICSTHFAPDCFEGKPDHLIVPGDTDILRLMKIAVPTLNFVGDSQINLGNQAAQRTYKMPNCCVPSCNNSSYKGYLLKCFPKNEKRRIEWIKNINRPDWTPHSAHRVCEVHFAPDMWEKTRVDGSRKLKLTAVPTVFGKDVVNKPSLEALVLPIKNFKEDKSNSSTQGQSLLKNLTLNNATLIKILQPNTPSTQTSSVIPVTSIIKAEAVTPTGAIIVNNKGLVINSSMPSTISGGTSILKPVIKTTSVQSSPMLISTNANILKNQIKAASSQTPIIIPASTTILKPQNSQVNLTNVSNSLPFKVVRSETLIPAPVSVTNQNETAKSKITIQNITNVVKIQPKLITTEAPSNKSIVNTSVSEAKSLNKNSQDTPNLKTNSIILNKTEAKKIDEERFEKMDKLLLKQLKLNNALRKKLHCMSQKMKILMKEQNNKTSFLRDVFTDDQIRALELKQQNPKSITAWSHKTMMKALKLKQECGTRGYEELLKQHMPLPSIRTLCRWCTSKDIPLP